MVVFVKFAGLSGKATMTARDKMGTRARESPIMNPSIMQVLKEKKQHSRWQKSRTFTEVLLVCDRKRFFSETQKP